MIRALARRTGGLSDDRRDALVARLQEQIETEQRADLHQRCDARRPGRLVWLGSISQGGGQVLVASDDRGGSRAVEAATGAHRC